MIIGYGKTNADGRPLNAQQAALSPPVLGEGLHLEHPQEAAETGGRTEGEDGEAAGMAPLSAPTRRALELLATSPNYGWTVSFLAANDVSGKLIFSLIRRGLAIAKTEEVRPTEVT